MDDNVCHEFLDLVVPAEEFQYSPIQPGWIRMLDLLNKPGDDEPLRCRLRQVELQSPEADYNALSYVWGSDRKPFAMQVLRESRPGSSTSTGTIHLTRSLYHALRDLRDCAEIQPKTFWIDQICIDQGNEDEKSHQVSQMGKVFAHATRVWTYLGSHQETDDEALDLFARIYDHFEPLSRNSDLSSLLMDEELSYNSNANGMYSRMARDDIPSGFLFPEDLFQGEPGKKFEDLNWIISGPWIERLWLYQENILNNDLSFFRGQRTLNAEAVEILCKLSFISLIPWVRATYEILHVLEQRHNWHRQEESASQMPLERLIISTSSLLCQDPRDRIYAILGVASDAKQLNIYPDYTISAVQVFTNLSVAFTKRLLALDGYHPLEDLLSVGREVSLNASYELIPTWAPTYLGGIYWNPQITDFDASQTSSRQSSKKFAGQIRFESKPDVENGLLVVKGMRLNLMLEQNLGSIPHWSLSQSLTMTELEQILAILENIQELDRVVDHLLSRFWETCMMGRDTLDSTVEQTDVEAAAAAGFRDVLQLLQRAQAGDRIVVDREYINRFYVSTSTLPGGVNSMARLFLDGFMYLADRSLWISKDQYVCLTPPQVQKDDIAVILFGGKWIYYLRPVGDKFEYIGYGYSAGFMHGEPFVDGWEDKVETFKLI
ncbi:hypothetical protein N0V82_009466 [Gnomoniopsis sp. IMI 355080]|nr:hypothetical protein N0V82_009466 [Gnomoniopsis sp. IMI 355080]